MNEIRHTILHVPLQLYPYHLFTIRQYLGEICTTVFTKGTPFHIIIQKVTCTSHR